MARESSSPPFQPTYPSSFHPEFWGKRPLTDLEDKQRHFDDALGRMFRSVYWGPHFPTHEIHPAPQFQPTYPSSFHPEFWGKRPLTDLDEEQRHFDDALGRMFRSVYWGPHFPTQEKHWAPPIEMFEKEDKVVIKVELPGIKGDEIDVSVVGDRLVVKGERKSETEVKEEDYYTCEHLYGSCSRTVALPTDVDTEKIEASFENGVLEVTFPKTAGVKAKKIPVSVKKKATK